MNFHNLSLHIVQQSSTSDIGASTLHSQWKGKAKLSLLRASPSSIFHPVCTDPLFTLTEILY